MDFKKVLENAKNIPNVEEKYPEWDKFLIDIMEAIKKAHPDKYECYTLEFYKLNFGETLNKDIAKEWVDSMKPNGERWTIDEAAGYKPSSLNVNNATWYAVLNMMYNDYYDIFKEDADKYIKLSYQWLNDIDAPSGDKKTFLYYTKVIK